MGYGLKAVFDIGPNENLIKMKTNLGLLSSSLVDSMNPGFYDDLKAEGKLDADVKAIEAKD